MLALKNIKRPK